MMKWYYLAGLLFCCGQLAFADFCGPVLLGSEGRLNVDKPSREDSLLAYLRTLYGIGLLNSRQMEGFIANVRNGSLVNPLEADELDPRSSAVQIHADRIAEFLKQPIDRLKLLLKLEATWTSLQAEANERQTVTEVTHGLFAPVAIPLSDPYGNFEIRDWHLQLDGFPVFSTWIGRGAGVKIIDFRTSVVRPVNTEVSSTGLAFIQLRSGRSLVAFVKQRQIYSTEPATVHIEDVQSGEEVATIGPKDFHIQKDAFAEMHFDEDVSGTVTLYIRKENGSSEWLAYNINEKHAYRLTPESGPVSATKPSFGQNFVISLKDPRRLVVRRVSENSSQLILDEDLHDQLGDWTEKGSHRTWGGRTVFYSYTKKEIRIFDPARPGFRTIDVTNTVLDAWPFIGFDDSQPNDLGIVVRCQKKPGENWRIGRFDDSSQFVQSELPNSDEILLVSDGGAILHHYPKFLPLKLSDKRTLLIGLSQETNHSQEEMAANKLYVVDLSNMETEVLDVSEFDVGALLDVQKLADGRVVGYFSRSKKLKILQILGPHDEKTFEDIVRENGKAK